MWNVLQHVRTVGSLGTSMQQGAPRIRRLNWPVMCSVRNLDRPRRTSAGGGNTYSPDMYRDD